MRRPPPETHTQWDAAEGGACVSDHLYHTYLWIFLIHPLYVPYIFPKYVPCISPAEFLNSWSERVDPDMTEVRVWVKFRTLRTQNLIFDVISKWFYMALCGEAQKTRL